MQKMTMEKLLKDIHNFFAGTSKQAQIFRAATTAFTGGCLLGKLTGLVFLHGGETRRGHGPRPPYGLRRDFVPLLMMSSDDAVGAPGECS